LTNCSFTGARIKEIAHELDEPESVEEAAKEEPIEKTEPAIEPDVPAVEEVAVAKESEAKVSATADSTDAEVAPAETAVVVPGESISQADDALTLDGTTPTESKAAETPVEATPEQGWGEESHE